MTTGPVLPDVSMCIVRRDVTEPRVHPDGTSVSFVARSGGAAAIVSVPVDGGPERQLTTAPPPIVPRGLGGGCHDWLPDGSGFVYAAADGAIWWQRVPGGAPTCVWADPDGRAVVAPSIGPDGAVVASVVDQAEIWLAALDDDGEALRVDDGADDFCSDPHVSAGPRPGTWRVEWQAWSVPDMPWDGSMVRVALVERIGGAVPSFRVAERGRRDADGAVQQPRRTPDGRVVEVRDDTGWLQVWCDGRPVVDDDVEHAGPSWGPGQRSYAVSPDGTELAFTRNEAGFGRLCVVDLASGDVRTLGRGVHGQLDWRGDVLVATRSGARTPNQVVAYRPASAAVPVRRTLATGPVAGWDAVDLVEPELVEIPYAAPGRADGSDGSDGSETVTLHARRYPAGQGRLLCWVHGGPTDQWQVEFNVRVAYWRARGWDVLAVDPRGTTGHGRDYQQALHGGWGRVDVDDTAALVRHAHEQGWARPDTTVVVGGSSGGLTVLGVLADHAELVAGGVAVYPVTDLADLADRSHRFEAHYTLTLVGPLEDVDRYRERSPLHRAERIAGPLLVLHGSEDPVVPVDQSVALVDAVRAAGGDVELHVFDGEGHGFRAPEAQRAEYRLIGDFLGRVVPAR